MSSDRVLLGCYAILIGLVAGFVLERVAHLVELCLEQRRLRQRKCGDGQRPVSLVDRSRETRFTVRTPDAVKVLRPSQHAESLDGGRVWRLVPWWRRAWYWLLGKVWVRHARPTHKITGVDFETRTVTFERLP